MAIPATCINHVECMNALLVKHLRAERRYGKVLPHTRSLRLTNLYQRGQKQHRQMAADICSELRRLGHQPIEATDRPLISPPPSKAKKPVLSNQGVKAILGGCIRGESKCLEASKSVLEMAKLPTSSKALLRNHCAAMELSMLNLRTEELAAGLRS